MKPKLTIILTVAIFFLIVAGVYVNIKKQQAVDSSKIPQKVELSRQFQRWITNLKNKSINVSADDFTLVEKNEIYNTRWMTVYSMDDPVKKAEYENTLKTMSGVDGVVFSPSGRELIDYRNQVRGDYLPNQVHFYGQKEDKIIDARLLDCISEANCYFDRAYFLDNDVFVISEISRNFTKKDTSVPVCTIDSPCTYTIKLHVINLIKNSRFVYESKPFEDVLSKLIPEL